jgi:hypothetical protein
MLELDPGTQYEIRLKFAEIHDADFGRIWKSGTPKRARDNQDTQVQE